MRNNNQSIKVLVVDDSSLMRMIISDALSSDEKIEVIGTAKNGMEAIQKIKELEPDVVTLDIEMPVMDGFSCLKEIMKIKYIPVVMLSGLSDEEAVITMKSLEMGAVDFIPKPKNIFNLSNDIIKNDIIEKIIVASKTTEHKSKHEIKANKVLSYDADDDSGYKSIVVIGASTGGPKSLKDVISEFPGNIPAAFLIVQHIAKGFTKSLAERLDLESELTVKVAEDGERIKVGCAYIAPGNRHMELIKAGNETFRIKLSDGPPKKGLRPSIDITLKSVSDTGFKNIISVIMTGMGSDGSEGIKAIKEVNKGYIIAQDESSSVVFGMPRAAIDTGCVDKVVPLELIAKEIINSMEAHS